MPVDSELRDEVHTRARDLDLRAAQYVRRLIRADLAQANHEHAPATLPTSGGTTKDRVEVPSAQAR